MKAKTFAIISLIAVLALTLSGPATASIGATLAVALKPAEADSTQAKVAKALHPSPVMFIQNVGQFDERALFQVRGADRTIWLAEDALWVTVVETPPHPPGPPSPLRLGEGKGGTGGRGEVRSLNLRLSFPGSNPHPRIEPFNRLDTVVSYFIDNDPAKWRSDVLVWGGVRYMDLYPGVDLVVGAGLVRAQGPASAQGRPQGSLPWCLEVHDGTDLSTVRLRIDGADAVELLPGGEGLLLTTAIGDFTLPLLLVEGWNGERPNVQRISAQTFDVLSPFASSEFQTSGFVNPQSDHLLYAKAM